MLQAIYLSFMYKELWKYKFQMNRAQAPAGGMSEMSIGLQSEKGGATPNQKSMRESAPSPAPGADPSQSMISDQGVLKIGIIGCGQVGTMILTKLLEIQTHLSPIKIYVSTRQPHLLKEFKQEFDIEVDFNNEVVAAKCDLIFLCCLPFQSDTILKEIRGVITERQALAQQNKFMNMPLVISTLAAVGVPKLKLLLTEDTKFMRTIVDVTQIKEDITQSNVKVDPNDEKGERREDDGEEKKSDNGQTNLDGSDNDGISGVSGNKASQKSLVLSTGNIFNRDSKINAESGITPDFIIKQASSNLVKKLDDLFNMFDVFQEVFYSSEKPPVIEEGEGE